MYNKMIVATDLSAASDAVVGCLSSLKRFGIEQALLLQCLSFNDAASASFAYDTEPLEEMLEDQKAMLEKQGFTFRLATKVTGVERTEAGELPACVEACPTRAITFEELDDYLRRRRRAAVANLAGAAAAICGPEAGENRRHGSE